MSDSLSADGVEVEVLLLPSEVGPGRLAGRAVAVFDVLRATTTMAAALAAGVREIRVFADLDSARRAFAEEVGPGSVGRGGMTNRPLLCGEQNCLRPEGFDLGNSPGALEAGAHGGRVLFMSTTNGTRAIAAARAGGAEGVFPAALVNARAAARALAATGLPVTLLCAGTNGEVAMEDLLGAGAVIERLRNTGEVRPTGDVAAIATRLFAGAREGLRPALAEARGGRNVIAAGLAEDIDFASALDRFDVVGRVADGPLRVVGGRQ